MPPPASQADVVAKLEEIRLLLIAIQAHLRCLEHAAREIREIEP